MQVRTKLEDAVNAGVVNVPEVACAPDQAPVAVHEVVLVEDHVSVLVPPEATEVGLAEIESVAGGVTVTVAACEIVPPAPLHDNE